MTVIRGIVLRGKWSPAEVAELHKILVPLPPAWLEENPCIDTFVRRPILIGGPPDAPGHSKYDPSTRSIVVFDKGVYHGNGIDPEQFRRSIYHELAHTILRCQPDLLNRWIRSTREDDFVDDYAKTAPDEDFADTFSEYFIFPGQTRKVVPRKAAFMKSLLAESRRPKEKVAMPLIQSFTDELTKTARGAVMSKILSAVRSPYGKGAVAVGGGAGALEIGRRSGRQKGESAGYAKGTQGMSMGMRKAYEMGVRRGAMAMQQSIVRQLRAQQTQRR